jgi:phosphatidylethanolamine/phosphatidyl-N-methylethanolamine N-methyltransferase
VTLAGHCRESTIWQERTGQAMIDTQGVMRSYRRWAPVYDIVFGKLFAGPRAEAAEAARRVGGRVLEVGVGTGIALASYKSPLRVVGIDVSRDMLARARKRVTALGLDNVEELVEMDAQRLAFDDASFDVVMAQYVVNTVPDPDSALDEFARVLRPGGEIILVNRIGAESGPRRAVERGLQPIVERLGWRSEFPFARFEAWLARWPGLHLVERRPMPPFGHFALLRVAKLRVS